MNEHLVAARAALADLIEYHDRGWAAANEAMAALAKLDLTEPPSAERPGPEPAWDDQAAHVAAHAAFRQSRAAERAAEVEVVVTPKEPAFGEFVAKVHAADVAAAAEALAVERHRCECGRCFTRAQALGSHRRFCEAQRAAAFDADVVLAQGQSIFRCDTCTAVHTTKQELAQHTITSHQRGPTHDENTPLADRAVRA